MENIEEKIRNIVEEHSVGREFSGSDFYFEMLDELIQKDELVQKLTNLFQEILSEKNL